MNASQVVEFLMLLERITVSLERLADMNQAFDDDQHHPYTCGTCAGEWTSLNAYAEHLPTCHTHSASEPITPWREQAADYDSRFDEKPQNYLELDDCS